jgi:O-6-methylguanine DNA methyltransferase
MTDQIAFRLASLKTAAPASLLPGSLVRIGLADLYVIRSAPIGEVFVAFSKRGVASVAVAPSPEAFAASHLAWFGRPALPAADLPRALGAQLDRALVDGKPGRLPLDLTGLGPFQAAVLLKASEIPRGETRPYQWVAREIGKPGASRAVGSALASNPVPLIVPCHRVVRSDGRLGRYSLGSDSNKRLLLESEGLDPDALEAAAARGVRFLGSSTTAVFCHPTCRYARTIKAPHRVEFRGAPEASAAGYRPCKHCRPSSPPPA